MLDLVIPDSGPLITFALIDRLDLLDRFTCAIVVTDMVAEEVLRGSDAAVDKARFQRWFEGRGNRIQTVETTYGMMWKALSPEDQQRIKRQRPHAGELSIQEFTDTLRDTLPASDQVLVLFEEDAVKRKAFGAHVHLIHTYAFVRALEELQFIPSADALYEEVFAAGRNLARDVFERRALNPDGSAADWKSGYGG
jgi:hypothetical protein